MSDDIHEPAESEAVQCPGCGGITDDPAGGPCSLCWSRTDPAPPTQALPQPDREAFESFCREKWGDGNYALVERCQAAAAWLAARDFYAPNQPPSEDEAMEAAWRRAKRSDWPGERDGFVAGYRAALAARGVVVQWADPSEVKVGDKALDLQLFAFRRVTGIRPYGEHGGYEVQWEGDEEFIPWDQWAMIVTVADLPVALDRGEPTASRQAMQRIRAWTAVDPRGATPEIREANATRTLRQIRGEVEALLEREAQ